MKVVHAADLHVDSPLRGLSRYEGAPLSQLRGATRRALENLVQLCLDQDAKLLLIAGDVFDGNWRDYSTGLFFSAQMARLRQADVQVVMLRGNHDAQSQISKQLRLPENVHELSSRKPESMPFEAHGIVVHGQGFATAAVLEDLAHAYPSARSSLFNIGLLHTSLGGRVGHEPYAPTTLDVLRGKGYDYWALGHVHAREVVCEEPMVIFPGNLQGRHAREIGPKGASVLTVEDGRLLDVQHHALDVVRWLVCVVELGVADDVHDAVERVRAALSKAAAETADRLLAVRLRVCGRARAHAALVSKREQFVAECQNAALDVGGGAIWIEKVLVETQSPLERSSLATQQDALGEIARALQRLSEEPAELSTLVEGIADLRRKLPSGAMEGDNGIAIDDPAFLATLLPDVRELLFSRLLDGEGETP